MSHYYLMAQLPSLDGLSESSPLPITEEEFLENCSRFLDEKSMKILRSLSLAPARDLEGTGSALVDAWNQGERTLRLALGSVRSGMLKKSFDPGGETLSAPLVQVARNAVEMDDPLQAEKPLHQHRMRFLEDIRPLDEFSVDAVYYYCLKLKLMHRIRLFDADLGRESYRNIYESILHGDNQESVK